MHNETHIFVDKSKGDDTAAPKDTIVSGGFKVIQKRSVESADYIAPISTIQYEYDYSLEQPNTYNGAYIKTYNDNQFTNVDNNAAAGVYSTMLGKRRKRQGPHFINVTRIIKVRKTTESSTTTTTTQSSSFKANRVRTKATTASAANQDELEFELKTKASTKAAVEKALSQVMNEIVSGGKSSSGRDREESAAEKAVQSEIEQVVVTSKKPKKVTDSDRLAATSAPRFTAEESSRKTIEKENYFGQDPFDSGSKNRDRIVLVNDSAWKLVKPSLQTSVVYHRWDVHRIFLVFLFFILAGKLFGFFVRGLIQEKIT